MIIKDKEDLDYFLDAVSVISGFIQNIKSIEESDEDIKINYDKLVKLILTTFSELPSVTRTYKKLNITDNNIKQIEDILMDKDVLNRMDNLELMRLYELFLRKKEIENL